MRIVLADIAGSERCLSRIEVKLSHFVVLRIAEAHASKPTVGTSEPEGYFVAVTWYFNTTTSTGRLTLKILLSFAQFECEVIGERSLAGAFTGMQQGRNAKPRRLQLP